MTRRFEARLTRYHSMRPVVQQEELLLVGEAPFAKEADLCAAFIGALPKEWTAYPETGGFDILLVRADGFQIGVEAKLKLNAKVICQAAENDGYHYAIQPGPDCRAVLIPSGVSMDLASICGKIGLTVITVSKDDHLSRRKGADAYRFRPDLPTGKHYWEDEWKELCPAKRLVVPDWVPDVRAGESAPVALTDWKVRAIKIVITIEKRGYVTRQDFTFFKVSMSRWTQSRWIVPDGKGGWIANGLPDFRAQHPVNFPQIEADYEKWKNPAVPAAPAKQEAML